PYPPKASGATRLSAAAGKVSLPPNLHVQTGPEIKNPAATLAAGLRPPLSTVNPGPIGMGAIMSAPAGTAPSPSHSRPRPGSTRSNTLAPAARVCMGPPAIASVEANHSTDTLQFTPDGSTEYIITGCGFGNTPGRVSLTGNFAAHGGQIALLPYHPFGTPATGWDTHWSDSRIEVIVDPSVSGEMDLSAVTLAVTPATGAPLRRSNLGFHARRGGPILLSRLPASAYCSGTTARQTCAEPGIVSLYGALASPCGAWVMHDCTVEVLRNGFHLPAGFKMPEDVYTLNLKPGFVLYSAAVEVVGLDDKVAHVMPVPIIRGDVIMVQPPIYGDPTNTNSYTLSL
ncbi:MAG: hypothetical protein ACRD2D_12760, partial [Terriglobales bacterium]